MMTFGINYSDTDDSSVRIFRDCEVLCGIAAARICACFDFGGVRTKELGCDCQGWRPPRGGRNELL